MKPELDWQEVKDLLQTRAGHHPSWIGRIRDDRPIYILYQSGYLSVSLQRLHLEPGLFSHPEVFGIQFGDEDDDEMETEEMLAATGIVLLP